MGSKPLLCWIWQNFFFARLSVSKKMKKWKNLVRSYKISTATCSRFWSHSVLYLLESIAEANWLWARIIHSSLSWNKIESRITSQNHFIARNFLFSTPIQAIFYYLVDFLWVWKFHLSSFFKPFQWTNFFHLIIFTNPSTT